VIGAAQSPARAINPPTAIAPLAPILRAPEAVPRIEFTMPASGIGNGTALAMEALLTAGLPVAPSKPIVPNMARRKTAAKAPPAACANT